MGEEQVKQFVQNIQNASRESLEKFFILNKITEALGIEIDRKDQGVAVEKKIYDHFNPTTDKESSKPKAKSEKEKPAKKGTKKAA
ncbi:MAG: hypothetical protein LBD75_06910 [Candidatus Peribacteria bacterium]|jgi:endo-alpha-1,4-polygalactosaminidase (GH114 family)|nr:hypothetical protein [Candidatus Peribacteria bacterium]